ncbi:MAG: hypothetical protein A3B74_04475 [Candidatus Kerfeldbacteria bacterium RIFCSPHIGHO2_02_FULL_42_14]|uniref:Serine aminopeptidase S33 domain-containing protein n=1 Tax=Candidatus Kerfeldbacteria bacterium RIFCSPHIGHO2_02_FULL_42_14 TaxID=1798540 RepID=A0A1G2APX6_9BACT|nr:MAG: hypothetical protein A3B74_04475 [Candidatus Kerfeldbacteria bacterium RIFCSPHIGHO2_02_FULL_42_14]OGY80809.1 MAG: hypothetical protein A3E60_01345 [Candidatus Kerfeldbacteria bacterium RIFCSPHIGHO2_12_FULL_42_13]OGY84980.1 MAG: hypothetical protein A3I91_00680 [Candidatus Kerfeldbacteria bacterium RIFCSPLOWO2_02_FULL_42_19]OGY86148.1 MAG: hypothetical protein A3G01_02215 [Candidatus Kerfeldbacteria bacterium RIFCSPLOWO2_12_FULL_43_9]
MQSQELTILNTYDEALAGELWLPLGQQKSKTLILAHAFSGDRHESGENFLFDFFRDRLLEEGIGVCQFDFSGCGKSEGNFRNTSITKRAQDLAAVIETIRSRPDVRSDHVGVLGRSIGALATLARGAEGIKTLILLATFTHAFEVFQKLFQNEGTYNPDGISTLKGGEKVLQVGPILWQDAEKYSFEQIVQSLYIPILFVQGAQDTLTPLSEVEPLYHQANEPKALKIIPKAGHGFETEQARSNLIEIILAWVGKYL